MTLARNLPDDATEWWIFLGVAALYLGSRWFLAWRQARRDGDSDPVRTAFAEEEPDAASMAFSGGFRSYRQFFGVLAAAVVVVLVVTLTEDRLEMVLMCTLVPVLVMALAYLDFRQARTARARA
ncbi:hypothetical protein [Streptomyces albidochromogenes]|uniref:Uncharacterized protein n=1 Tax=Streptomyces albidochromogenes TaxID=329524 RepID=A0ABW6FJE5_9ACTN